MPPGHAYIFTRYFFYQTYSKCWSIVSCWPSSKCNPATLVLELALDKAENHRLTYLLSNSDKKVETVHCNLFRSLVVVNLYHLFYCKLIISYYNLLPTPTVQYSLGCGHYSMSRFKIWYAFMLVKVTDETHLGCFAGPFW